MIDNDNDANVLVYERDESKGRRAYVIYLFCIFIVIPIFATVLGNVIGVDFQTFRQIDKYNETGQHILTGFKMNILSVWYLSIPLFVWCTYRRVTDTNINAWLTPLFLLPVINLIIWFWPPKKIDVSDQTQ